VAKLPDLGTSPATVIATSATVIAADPARDQLRIQSLSTNSAAIYLARGKDDADASVANCNLEIAAGGHITITGEEARAAWRAVSASGSQKLILGGSSR
jgi:hypothetical protein